MSDRHPIKTWVENDPLSFERLYRVRWSDGAIQSLTRQQAEALRQEHPAAFTDPMTSAQWPTES